jgi:hypothetical protein
MMTMLRLVHLGTAAAFAREGVPPLRDRSNAQRSRAANLNLEFEAEIAKHPNPGIARSASRYVHSVRRQLAWRHGYPGALAEWEYHR